MKEKKKKTAQTTQKKRMPKSKKLLIMSVALLVAGLGVFFYPGIAKLITDAQQSAVIDEFNHNLDSIGNPTVPENDDEASETPLMNEEEAKNNKHYDPRLLAKLYSDIRKYNNDIYTSGQTLLDPFCYSQESFDLAQYSVYDYVFGYITAPSIDLNLPIYLGASDYNMWNGAAQMTGTSIPIGGKNTNAVIAGHRGVINKTLFDNIVFLNEGDSVFVKNLWEKLEYKVVKTEVILPSESDKVKIQKGKDMLTLITCHPYGYSDYRYVVYCERA
ncbi:MULTISPECIES: class C sortase [unclassified Ruminococcus]|uniref:class C sortase n=1 Tax=unclassified Ruminococcus TaxID=2608920 RepID=UPI00210E14D4|nr:MULTISPECIES: class C sortase [unclassified Ruminococcus]MCQ4022021.1 class C sortase [Ruminococcus sp. zg-924]MCQ4114557.1 class C sortase [Ruminococcus sp. zg-921]